MPAARSGGATTSYAWDASGRLLNDGEAYTWDRADRMLGRGTTQYQYNGLGQRLQKSEFGATTQYLLDTQPGLTHLIAATQGATTTRYLHGPLGIAQQQNPDTAWLWMVQDGLGSVRSVVNSGPTAQATAFYAPYGEPIDYGVANLTPFGFTGEPTDANGLVYLRARYYIPALGVFPSLDPLEGEMTRAMSLNRYGYVEGNVVNATDPAGLCPEAPFAIAEKCEGLRAELKTWGIDVVYDANAQAPYACCPEDVKKAAEQAQGIRQRWTYLEMGAIHNAFRVFAQARTSIGFGALYAWPLTSGVTIEKRRVIPPPGLESDLGIHIYPERRIVLSAKQWGESSALIIAGRPMTFEYRSWLVLHEFSHIFAKDRASVIAPKLWPSTQMEPYLSRVLPIEIDSGGFGKADKVSGQLRTLTGYPSATFFPQEYIIEAVTGTLWNYGYRLIDGFGSDAGGRTGVIGNPGTFWNVRDIISYARVGRGPQKGVSGVPLPFLPAGTTLEQWVLNRIILDPTQP